MAGEAKDSPAPAMGGRGISSIKEGMQRCAGGLRGRVAEGAWGEADSPSPQQRQRVSWGKGGAYRAQSKEAEQKASAQGHGALARPAGQGDVCCRGLGHLSAGGMP